MFITNTNYLLLKTPNFELDIELYRGYLNTGFICNDLLNKSLNNYYSYFIYCGAYYSITD